MTFSDNDLNEFAKMLLRNHEEGRALWKRLIEALQKKGQGEVIEPELEKLIEARGMSIEGDYVVTRHYCSRSRNEDEFYLRRRKISDLI